MRETFVFICGVKACLDALFSMNTGAGASGKHLFPYIDTITPNIWFPVGCLFSKARACILGPVWSSILTDRKQLYGLQTPSEHAVWAYSAYSKD